MLLGKLDPGASSPEEATARLGDWYAKQVQLESGSAIVLLSAPTLLPVVMPGSDIAAIESDFGRYLSELLQRLDVPAATRAAEVDACASVAFRRAEDRSLLASLNDAGQLVAHLSAGDATADLTDLALRMATRPSKRLGYRFPAEAAVESLSGGGASAF